MFLFELTVWLSVHETAFLLSSIPFDAPNNSFWQHNRGILELLIFGSDFLFSYFGWWCFLLINGTWKLFSNGENPKIIHFAARTCNLCLFPVECFWPKSDCLFFLLLGFSLRNANRERTTTNCLFHRFAHWFIIALLMLGVSRCRCFSALAIVLVCPSNRSTLFRLSI